MSSGHAIAAVTDTEASESWRNVGPSERSPAALTRDGPVVPVNLVMLENEEDKCVKKLFHSEMLKNL